MAKSVPKGQFRKWLPPRKKTASKGDAGRVLILAGSRDMAGAAVLSASSALRSGAGLVQLVTVKSRQAFAVKRGPLEMTTRGLGEDKEGRVSQKGWKEFLGLLTSFRPTVVALGPGLGQTKSLQLNFARWARRNEVPLVLDADGLNLLARVKPFKFKGPVVLTPHPGEMGRLLNQSVSSIQAEREKAVRRAARQYGAVCLLKGDHTLTTDGQTVFKNPTGNPGMASGGMGDVLTGIIAALWAQMPEKNLTSGFQAAAMGAYVHGWTGDRAVKEKGQMGLVAGDVIETLPAALKKIFKR